MRFLPYTDQGRPALAVVTGDEAFDLTALDARLPNELDTVAAGGAAILAAIKVALAKGSAKGVPVASLTPRYPVSGTHKVICVGLNYALHAKEGGNEIPTYPAFFLRVRDSMTGPGEPMVRPTVSDKFDYEAELMIVIGTGGRHIPEASALDHVFGYTCFNDGSVRDFQRKSSQWTPGKNFDRTGGVGPVIVTPDELPPGAHGLKIASRLNGQTMQSSNTNDMIFSVAKAVSICSEFTTLRPGDMIAMGTPEGVGYARKPPVFMKPGDTIEIEIEGIGVLSNPVVAEA